MEVLKCQCFCFVFVSGVFSVICAIIDQYQYRNEAISLEKSGVFFNHFNNMFAILLQMFNEDSYYLKLSEIVPASCKF
jgi:hypothetical protein